jgi:hypothetical protein
MWRRVVRRPTGLYICRRPPRECERGKDDEGPSDPSQPTRRLGYLLCELGKGGRTLATAAAAAAAADAAAAAAARERGRILCVHI